MSEEDLSFFEENGVFELKAELIRASVFYGFCQLAHLVEA